MELFQHRRRVLLVEDERQVYATLRRRLEENDYTVTLATTFDDAVSLMQHDHFHVGIFDLRLVAAEERNQQGIRLVEEVIRLGLAKVMPCIIITAHANVKNILYATQELGVRKFITKDPGYISKVIAAVDDLFQNEVKINTGLTYREKSLERLAECAHHIHQAEDGARPNPQLLQLEMLDLMGRLFQRAQELLITRLVKGLSGSVVLYVLPDWHEAVGQMRVVKISRADKIRTEQRNYEKYVEHYLPVNHATTLDEDYTRHLGALMYTMANVDVADIQTFEDYYGHHSAAEITAALHSLFRDTCERWYRGSPARQRLCSLRDMYYKAFNLTPDRLPQEVLGLVPALAPDAPTIQFPEPAGALPNPLQWLIGDESTTLPVVTCITHGDLNARNILISDEGECWLIDFYRTYPSHILRDFCELETEIKFRLLAHSPADIETFYQFEQALVQLANPQAGLTPPGQIPAEMKKAADVIVGLRAEAWALVNWPGAKAARQVQREYLISLLMATLNILRLRHFKEVPALQPQRERALLSAALICRQLQVLRTPH